VRGAPPRDQAPSARPVRVELPSVADRCSSRSRSIENVRLIDAISNEDWYAMSDLGQLIAYWGYPAIFVIVVLGNVGLPVPEETTLIVAGYLVWQGYFRLSIVLAVGVISAVTGDNIGYRLGRRYPSASPGNVGLTLSNSKTSRGCTERPLPSSSQARSLSAHVVRGRLAGYGPSDSWRVGSHQPTPLRSPLVPRRAPRLDGTRSKKKFGRG
jgi:hypothetical protein